MAEQVGALERRTLSVRLAPEVFERLDELAREDCRSRESVARKALELFVRAADEVGREAAV